MAIRDYTLSDAQSRTNPTSTGTVSANILDLQLDASGGSTIITDDQAVGFMNVVLTIVTYTSGGTEGIALEVRTDDAAALNTAKDGVSAGYAVIGMLEVPKEEIATGAKFSIPYRKDKAKSFIGGWLRAVSTTYTGIIVVDAWLDNSPISENDHLQKMP